MKIVWAVDVFGTSKNDASRIGKFLKLFATKKAEVCAVYVATPQEPQLSTAFDIPELERFSKYPFSLLQTVTKYSGLSIAPRNHVVISTSTLSLTKAVDHLCGAMKRMKPDLIVVQTHQRKGLERAILGSFSETIIHRSNQSLLVVNPWHRLPKKISYILFADDLSPVSSKARHFVASLATQFKANVTIVHADYLYSYGKIQKIPGIDEYCRRIDRLLSRSHAYFTKRGIKAKSYVNGSDKSVADAVIDAAKRERADLIVVSAKARPLLALLGGSVTRKVVRRSVLPVIVYKS